MGKIFKPTVKYLFMTRTTSNKSKNSCPRKLDNCLVRRIHELVFEIDGRILKKNLPDEDSYKQVLIKLGGFPAIPDLNEAILEPDDLDDLDE